MAKQRDKGKGEAMPEAWVKRFGDEVQFQREERHMRQSDLAAATGYTPGMISQIENGLVTPSGDTIVRLARFLKLDLNRILGIRQPEPLPGVGGLPDAMGDPILVRTLAMINTVWAWPPEQRQAVVSVWRALAAAVEDWPASTAAPTPPPAQDPQDGTGEAPAVRSIRPSGTEPER